MLCLTKCVRRLADSLEHVTRVVLSEYGPSNQDQDPPTAAGPDLHFRPDYPWLLGFPRETVGMQCPDH